MDELVRRYYLRMRSLDSRFEWSDFYWWKSSDVKSAIVSTGDKVVGFGFVAGGKFVDDDVKSEICDIYCEDPSKFYSLTLKTLEMVSSPWGFQVIDENVRAMELFRAVLKKKGYEFVEIRSHENGIPVTKFRISDKAMQ